ncbi:MAG: HAMP domain-containing protein [Pseudomonadota bacterium]|nr:HAMP domain-containing protein [Pseudomonadota bacterium]
MAALSLRRRLSLAFAAVLALLIAFDIALTLHGASRRIDPEVANATALASGALREAVKGVAPGPDLDQRLAALATSFDRLRHVRVAFRPEGAAAVRAAPTRPRPPAWFVALVRPRFIAQTVAASVQGRIVGAFVVEGDPDDEIGELWDSLVTLTLDGAASAALGFAAISLVARFALAPLERLNAGLAALGRRDYAARLPEQGAPEFAPLLARFNALGASLEAAERENRQLRARLVSIQDEERKEIGRELHDEIGPYLFAARAQAGEARRAAPDAALDGLIETIDALQATNRRILDRLRPVALEELGLAAALDALGRFFARNSPTLDVSVDCADIGPLPPSLEAAIYRLAQEALTNVARHAGAGRARVTLAAASGELTLTVADDGRGLDPARPAGRGLIGMRERVAAHGGALTLTAAEPRGLNLRAVFPLEG